SAESMSAIPSLEDLPAQTCLQEASAWSKAPAERWSSELLKAKRSCSALGGRQLKPHDRVQRRSQQTIRHPGERLNKSIEWIHRERMRCKCASRMTARHSPPFAHRPG
ncbi:hypothetical protein N8608_02710, partial [bacterium]|nr:hypothetical protein [bacterium]